MANRWFQRWVTGWLERRGLGNVADTLDRDAVTTGDVNAMHAMARRAIERGEPADAVALLVEATVISPEDASLFCTLGAAHRQTGDFEASRKAYEKALALKPDYLQALSNLGEWCVAKGKNEEALNWFEKALQFSPKFFEARLNKAAALFELARYKEALSLAEQLVDAEPLRAEAQLTLGNLLVHTGKTKQGIKHYKKALELQPGYPEAHFNLASLLGSKADMAHAIGYLERRLKQNGDSIQTMGMLASAYQVAGRLSTSEEMCQRILERQPENITALITLGACLSSCGDSVAALQMYERVVNADASQAGMGSNILFEYNYVSNVSREQMFAHHLRWAARYEAPFIPKTTVFERNRSPNRRLRIGYVSGDFVRHPVGFLLSDILHHHDAEQFEIHCFSMAVRPDEVLPELRAAAHHWEDIFFLTDAEVDSLIREAEIDVLVDLSGHTAFHRLQVFARKPAPVQVEWVGYFHSTGLASIDYFITDPTTSPKDGGQRFSEIPVHMPHTRFCYGPPEYTPEVVPPPNIKTGSITFGSFNRLPKITDEVVRAWSKILHLVPGSRLVIKSAALSEALVEERLRARFAKHGVEEAQLVLREGSSHNAMLAEYGDIDIALDTFPFNGGMTTLEALWMGVPVVTIAGTTVVSRQTVSALANLGLADELAFTDVDAYIAGAVALAGSPARLAELRETLRPRMQASPLRDSKQFTKDLESLYRRMWAAWCDGRKLPSDVAIDNQGLLA